jgi:ribosomal protein L32
MFGYDTFIAWRDRMRERRAIVKAARERQGFSVCPACGNFTRTRYRHCEDCGEYKAEAA